MTQSGPADGVHLNLLLRDHDSTLCVGESALRKYVAKRRNLITPKEAFVRALYQPGDQAQFDFSPMRAIIANKEVLLEIFVMRLSFSGHIFARASIREDLPALMTGMLQAFIYFGGIRLRPLTCVNFKSQPVGCSA